MKNRPLRAAVALSAALTVAMPAALTPLAAYAGTSYEYKKLTPNLIVATASQPSAPAVTPPAVVGDGISKAGACSSGGATGCAVWNAADLASKGLSTKNDGLTVLRSSGPGWGIALATIGKSTGKWYWEVSPSLSGSLNTMVGVELANASGPYPGLGAAGTLGLYAYDGAVLQGAGTGKVFASFTGGDVIGFALDADAKTVQAYKNGVLTGTYTNVSANFPAVAPFQFGNEVTANFGQSNFRYAPPAGFNAGLW